MTTTSSRSELVKAGLKLFATGIVLALFANHPNADIWAIAGYGFLANIFAKLTPNGAGPLTFSATFALATALAVIGPWTYALASYCTILGGLLLGNADSYGRHRA